jgi:hypothetical protein
VTRDGNEDDDRRAFLKTCGRFAAVTPPVMTLLLSTSLTSKAIARSGGLNGATQGDKSQSVFDNDRSSAVRSGTSSSGGSSGGGGAPGGGRPSSPHAAAGTPVGGGSAGAGGNGKGPFATGGSSGSPTAYGGVDCADEEEERLKADCDRAITRVSSATKAEN